MSNINDEFNDYYIEQLGISDTTDEVTKLYSIISCLKDSKGKQTFLVRSKTDGKEFILKRTTREYEGELKNEYDTLSYLQNAAFPKVFKYFEGSSHVYLLREYIKGTSLYDAVEKNGLFDEQRAIETAVAVCKSLSYLHRQSPPVIHRDVKPQNIILTPEGRVVLVDMGTARRFKPDAHQDTNFMGTQATAAPEQYGFGQTDERCDIYAVGMLLVFLLTGGFAAGKNILQTISRPLRKVIEKCVALDRNKRFSNANTLRLNLERCLNKHKQMIRLCVSIAIIILFLAAGVGIGLAVSGAAAVQATAQAKKTAVNSDVIQSVLPSQPASAENKAQETPDAQESAANTAELTDSSSPVDPGATVVFNSPLIEKAVRLDLGKGDKEPILASDLDKVKQVMICGDVVFSDITKYDKYDNRYQYNGEQIRNQGTISNLDDISRLKNLETLILDKQDIKDISALKDLPLKVLSLCANKINDISVIKKYKGLTSLKIADNQITDISAISSLKHLETLDTGTDPISDISPLKELPIKELILFYTRIDDYSPLKELPALEILWVNRLNSEQVDVVGSLSHLRKLTIWNSGIKTLRTLSQLTGLDHLDISSNELTDIEGIEAFQSVKYLNIANNPITDISPLTKILKLEVFDVFSLKLTDFSVLLDMPYLQRVLCSQEQADEIKKLGKSLPFKIQLRT